MKVPFFDLTRQYEAWRDEIDAAVQDVLTSQRCIGGPHVTALEEALAGRVGVAEAVGVSSGTDALLVSLMALGVGPGDEVITTAFTFVAPVEAILRVGATPVFADIEADTFQLSVEAVEAAITPRTAAVLPVHLFGQTVDMTALMELCQARGIPVVEDLAQSLGATHRGRQAGSFGRLGAVSFFPTKNLGGVGDGGMVFCEDEALAARVRMLCKHGMREKYWTEEVGGNFRLDALQAAVLGAKLAALPGLEEQRRQHAAFYEEALAGIPGLRCPVVRDGDESVWNQYVLRCERRDALRDELTRRGVGTGVYYPSSLHHQPAFAHLGRWELPVTEQACREVLALPVFPELREEERGYVARSVREAMVGLGGG